MQIGVYGAGYLGTVVSACLADFGTPVLCCHPDSSRMVEMARGTIPFHEKNLAEIIKRSVRAGRLSYSTDVESFARKAQIIFLAEDAPQYLTDLTLRIARATSKPPILCIVTPVPVGAASSLEEQLRKATLKATIVSQPMFFTLGCAVEDFNWPDRIVLGTSSNDAVLALKQIFRSIVMRGVPVIVTNHETAELVREATTAFLATKISFINELASLCESVGADAVNLSLALGLDKKIAPRCLQPGAGMGGLFAESDMESLAGLARDKGVPLKVLTAAREVNQNLPDQVMNKIARYAKSVQNKDVGILGLAFKPNTNSVAGSSSVRLAKTLVANGARVRAYDPVAIPEARTELNGSVNYCDSPYAVAEGVDALVVGTGWPEFRALDFARIKQLLKRPLIIDTKNLLDSTRLRAMGFEYVGVGR
ncbi:MAG: UDP-glucose/GDP-mannose dehydrogenase family protein [Acidobacteriaceae bacterium]|nr:UDP-glucose/GDP-mannose dehydrogenase family protein [Acidobacteriaceae bacterium]